MAFPFALHFLMMAAVGTLLVWYNYQPPPRLEYSNSNQHHQIPTPSPPITQIISKQGSSRRRSVSRKKVAWVSGETCMICCEKMMNVEDCKQRKCGHYYHNECYEYAVEGVENFHCESCGYIECPICMDQIDFVDRKQLWCSHEFHRDCINKWESQSNTCPSCRHIF